MKYYDITDIWNRKPDYGIIVGGRSNGKSNAIAEKIIDQYAEDGSQFVRVVRYIFDTQGKFVADYFGSSHLKEYAAEKGYGIWYDESTYWIKPIGADNKQKDILGSVLCLSTEQKYKSNQYPRVRIILVEEFALLDSSQYLAMESEKFMSLCSTVVRQRNDVQVWLIGNTISKYNPYFTLLNVNIDKLDLHPGDIKPVIQPDFGYDESPRVIIEFAKMAYENAIEIPRILKVGRNETATTGLFVKPPDIAEPSSVKCKSARKTIVVQVGEEKFLLWVFPCFCYWQHCTGKSKTLKPDMLVRTMCYDINRYYFNAIKKLGYDLPRETYYDSEETKQYITDNIKEPR